jgi:mono/diheme cytochrome c family protein
MTSFKQKRRGEHTMIKGLKVVLGAAVAGLLAGTVLSAAPALAQSADDSELVSKGAYLARLGDCVACHTALHGKAFAGGLPIKTPIGTIYSTNITPDQKTGIGSYTLEDFDKALRQGVRKDGASLYPAMPYTAFSRMTDDDIKALYAYFLHSVAPIENADKAVTIPWPLSMRWPLAFWAKMFAPGVKAFTPATGADPVVARGEYLVTGPGHCGMCHTPRSLTANEKAYDAAGGPDFLAGGAPIDNWIAPSLRSDPVLGIGRWSEDDLVTFLRTGRLSHSAAFGGMADVVAWSTQYWTEDDLRATAKYLKSLPEVPKAKGDYVYDPSTAEALDSGKTAGMTGADIYVQQCAICHRNDGGAVDRMFPPLDGNPVVVSESPTSVAHIIVDGGVLPPTNWAPSAVAMPAYQKSLNDQQIADVVNFIRTSWGNKAPANATAADIAKLRAEGLPVVDRTMWNATPTSNSSWGLFGPQPYGSGWTFSPATHAGVDTPQ